MTLKISRPTILQVIIFIALFYRGHFFLSIRQPSFSHNVKLFSNKQRNEQIENFQFLKTLDERCRRLANLESEYLSGFYNNQLKCYQIYPYLNTKRVSITSTCIILNTILANPEHWEGSCSWESNRESTISLKEVINSLKNANWSTENPIQTPVILSTLCNFKSIDADDPKLKVALDFLLDSRSRLSLHRKQTNSAYIRYKTAKALLDIVENKIVPKEYVGSHQIGFALERSNVVAFDELCRQLAFYNSGDSANFDVIILAYSLLTYYETSKTIFLTSFARGVIEATNMKLIQSALAIIFEVQAEDGTWRKGEPIFTIPQVDSSNSRDIGNSYVFFFDMIGALLGRLAENEPTLLAPYLPQLERCLKWAEINVMQEMLPEVCDPNTFRCYGSVVRGWRSNHLVTNGAAGWCTAQVFYALTGLRKLLRSLITNDILEEFGGRKSSSMATKDWDNLMDAELELGGLRTTLKGELQPRFLQPLLDREICTKASLLPPPLSEASQFTAGNVKPSYSLILFGPPGTAKTTICTSIASYLGWSFLTIDTADFLADGLQNVASRMTYIFDRLRALERTIILFDEVEEFCLDRENPNLGMESRMLTTAMLTQLNDLRRQQASAFIVATNRLRSFDAAVTRPGRFDMILFVGTPNLAARETRIAAKLLSTRLSPEDQERARSFAREFMDSRWENMRFLTFAESEIFGNAVIELANRGELNRENLVSRLSVVLRTATIQGSVKEEYIASETLSRV